MRRGCSGGDKVREYVCMHVTMTFGASVECMSSIREWEWRASE